jgi:uncharacterized protein
MNKKVLDTNILIRFFTTDNKVMADKAETLIKNAKKNELVISDVIIAEIVWVLESFYELPKNEIIEKLEGLLNLDKFDINKNLLFKTVEYYKDSNISYTDAYLLAFNSLSVKNGTVYSFDKGLKKVDATVKEPN